MPPTCKNGPGIHNNINVKSRERIIQMTLPLHKLFACALLSILSITGCAKYKTQPLTTPHVEAQGKDGVLIQAALLDPVDEKNTFNGTSLCDHGFKAIQVKVINETDHTYIIDANKLNLELADYNRVINEIGFNGLIRALGWDLLGFTSIFFTPYLLIPCICAGLVHSFIAADANQAIIKDFSTRMITVGATCKIQPHSTMDKVMFISEENFINKLQIPLSNFETNTTEIYTFNL